MFRSRRIVVFGSPDATGENSFPHFSRIFEEEGLSARRSFDVYLIGPEFGEVTTGRASCLWISLQTPDVKVKPGGPVQMEGR